MPPPPPPASMAAPAAPRGLDSEFVALQRLFEDMLSKQDPLDFNEFLEKTSFIDVAAPQPPPPPAGVVSAPPPGGLPTAAMARVAARADHAATSAAPAVAVGVGVGVLPPTLPPSGVVLGVHAAAGPPAAPRVVLCEPPDPRRRSSSDGAAGVELDATAPALPRAVSNWRGGDRGNMSPSRIPFLSPSSKLGSALDRRASSANRGDV